MTVPESSHVPPEVACDRSRDHSRFKSNQIRKFVAILVSSLLLSGICISIAVKALPLLRHQEHRAKYPAAVPASVFRPGTGAVQAGWLQEGGNAGQVREERL